MKNTCCSIDVSHTYVMSVCHLCTRREHHSTRAQAWTWLAKHLKSAHDATAAVGIVRDNARRAAKREK